MIRPPFEIKMSIEKSEKPCIAQIKWDLYLPCSACHYKIYKVNFDDSASKRDSCPVGINGVASGTLPI